MVAHKDPAVAKAYYAAHREERLAQGRASHAAHRAERNAKSVAYRAAHPEEVKAANAAYRAAHREEQAAKSRAYRAAHPEKIKAANAAYYATHREAENARSAAYYAENPEKIKAKDAAYYATHREEAHAWNVAYRAAHPGYSPATENRRRARKANAPVNDFPDALWPVVLAAYDHRCVYCPPTCRACREKTHELTRDHITPFSKGGSHTLHNIVPACQSCNSKKYTGPPLKPVQPLLL